MNADEKLIEALCAECDALKASNAKLREQLAANTKFISELQHTLRLVQGTHAQQVKECAEKAAKQLNPYTTTMVKGLSDDCVGEWEKKAVPIICEAFGAPVDEYEQALAEAWRARLALGNSPAFPDFRDGFHAAWKLAKGESPNGFTGTGPDMNKLTAQKTTKPQWHEKP